jgi:hypothetical protein
MLYTFWSNMMLRCGLALALLASSFGLCHAQSTIFTSSTTFFANVQPGFYTENFSSVSGNFANGLAFSGNGFSYTLDGGAGAAPIFASGDVIGNSNDDSEFTFTFTSGNVRAIGANFFITDVNGDPVIATMEISLSDGTTTSYTTNGLDTEYRGFISPGPVILSLTMSAPGTGNFNTIDNFTVGNGTVAVPEPTTIAMLGATALGVGAYWYRRRRKLAVL